MGARRCGADVSKTGSRGQSGKFKRQVNVIRNEMHNELLTGKVMHRISTAGGCPIGISQGGIIGKLSHRPFSAGRANKLGEGGFGDAVKHAARASADRVCARQRNIWRKLILIRGLGWIRRWLG